MTTPIREARKGQLARYLREHDDRPVAAIELATYLQIGAVGGDRETKRRVVRMLVERLRKDGYAICAGSDAEGNGGYWIAQNDGDWRNYLTSRASGAKYTFVRVRQMAEAARDQRTGQQKMAFAGTQG